MSIPERLQGAAPGQRVPHRPLIRFLVGNNGWGGVAATESGVMLDDSRSCKVYGHVVYRSPANTSKLIGAAAWDGSDLFIVWPLPRFDIVTGKVREIIQREKFTGVKVIASSDLNLTTGTLSPGRLSYWLWRDRAMRLGGALGIA